MQLTIRMPDEHMSRIVRLGSDQAILLIFKQYRPDNRCFKALKGYFQG